MIIFYNFEIYFLVKQTGKWSQIEKMRNEAFGYIFRVRRIAVNNSSSCFRDSRQPSWERIKKMYYSQPLFVLTELIINIKISHWNNFKAMYKVISPVSRNNIFLPTSVVFCLRGNCGTNILQFDLMFWRNLRVPRSNALCPRENIYPVTHQTLAERPFSVARHKIYSSSWQDQTLYVGEL